MDNVYTERHKNISKYCAIRSKWNTAKKFIVNDWLWKSVNYKKSFNINQMRVTISKNLKCISNEWFIHINHWMRNYVMSYRLILQSQMSSLSGFVNKIIALRSQIYYTEKLALCDKLGIVFNNTFKYWDLCNCKAHQKCL
jgi:hypothetical protein